MSLAANENLPIIGVGEKLGESRSTEVAVVAGTKYIIKEHSKIYALPRTGEDDATYLQKRMNESLRFIAKDRLSQQRASSHLPANVQAPGEYYFIASGSDGYPVPFRIQRKVEGEALKNVPPSELDREQRRVLSELLRNSLNLYTKTGRFLDLVGSTVSEKPGWKSKVEKYLSPLAHSSNLFLTKDGEIALVDLQAVRPPGLIEGIVMFVLLARCYWQEVSKLRKEQFGQIEKQLKPVPVLK